MGRLGREYPSLKTTSKYLRTLFATVLDKMKAALDHDVFIPIFPKQLALNFFIRFRLCLSFTFLADCKRPDRHFFSANSAVQ